MSDQIFIGITCFWAGLVISGSLVHYWNFSIRRYLGEMWQEELERRLELEIEITKAKNLIELMRKG